MLGTSRATSERECWVNPRTSARHGADATGRSFSLRDAVNASCFTTSARHWGSLAAGCAADRRRLHCDARLVFSIRMSMATAGWRCSRRYVTAYGAPEWITNGIATRRWRIRRFSLSLPIPCHYRLYTDGRAFRATVPPCRTARSLDGMSLSRHTVTTACHREMTPGAVPARVVVTVAVSLRRVIHDRSLRVPLVSQKKSSVQRRRQDGVVDLAVHCRTAGVARKLSTRPAYAPVGVN